MGDAVMPKIPRARMKQVSRHRKEEQYDRGGRPQQRASNNPLVPGAAGMQSAFGLADLEAHSIVFDFPWPRRSSKQKEFHNRQKQSKQECPTGFEINTDGEREDEPTRKNSGFGDKRQKSLDGPHRRNRGMSILSPYFGGGAECWAAAGFGGLLKAVGEFQEHWFAVGRTEK